MSEFHEFIYEPILVPPQSELAKRLDAFKRKASDMCDFIETQEWGVVTIGVDRSDENLPKISGSIPDKLATEALYRRFRFFILNDEKSNYFRLLNLLSSASNNQIAHCFCRYMKRSLFSESSLEFAFITANRKYKPEDVINFWFNSYYFHDQETEREKLAEFQSIISVNGSEVVLFHAIWNSVSSIRHLNWIIHYSENGDVFLKIPVLCKI